MAVIVSDLAGTFATNRTPCALRTLSSLSSSNGGSEVRGRTLVTLVLKRTIDALQKPDN
jgi:hypothetical protein